MSNDTLPDPVIYHGRSHAELVSELQQLEAKLAAYRRRYETDLAGLAHAYGDLEAGLEELRAQHAEAQHG